MRRVSVCEFARKVSSASLDGLKRTRAVPSLLIYLGSGLVARS